MASLISLTNYKVHAGISGTAEDTLLQMMLDAASMAIRRACNRNETTGFENGTFTEKYDGTGIETIQLREWPVTSITSVTELFDDASTETIASTEYRANLRNGLLFMIGARTGRFVHDEYGNPTYAAFDTVPCWNAGFQNYTIVYVANGATIPADLQDACARITDLLYADRKSNPQMQSESLGAYSYTRASEFSKVDYIADLIAPFKTGEA